MPESSDQSNKLEGQSLPKKQLELSDYPISEWLKTIFRLKPLDAAKFFGIVFTVIGSISSVGAYFGYVLCKSTYEAQVVDLKRQVEKAEDALAQMSEYYAQQQRIITEQISKITTQCMTGEKPSKLSPSRWQDYPGFQYLAGTWHGNLDGFSGIRITIEPQDGDSVVATMELKNTACRISLILFQATDNMLTESEFFFRHTTATSGCPNIRHIMLRPNQSQARIRITSGDEGVVQGSLFKKL